jgi:hypothetical protein
MAGEVRAGDAIGLWARAGNYHDPARSDAWKVFFAVIGRVDAQARH